jgi:hypothetical protein
MKLAVITMSGSILFSLGMLAWIRSQPAAAFHDQGGMAITLIYFPATFLVWFFCSYLPSRILKRRAKTDAAQIYAPELKTLRWTLRGLEVVGLCLSLCTLFIA